MLGFSTIQWMLVAALAVLYLVTCLRVARQMRRIGRSPVRWFFITLLFTAIPASICFLWDNFSWLRGGRGRTGGAGPAPAGGDQRTIRCRRCRKPISAAELQTAPPPKTCPHCGALLDEEFLA